MTETEYEKYQKRLQKSKMTGNEFGLSCLLNHKINVIENLSELIRQLNVIGNNLNQIARAANKGVLNPPLAVMALQKGVDELWQLLRLLKGGKV